VQVEVKTKAYVTRDGQPRVVMTLDLVPRGSGNRANARRIAAAARGHRIMGPHITRVVVGASRVVLHMRASLGLLAAVNEVAREVEASRDVPGQLPLFAG